jgi:hypothetical protein
LAIGDFIERFGHAVIGLPPAAREPWHRGTNRPIPQSLNPSIKSPNHQITK